jgi:hypothetical protein
MQKTKPPTSLDLHLDGMRSDIETIPLRSVAQERREKTRIREAFPARICGIDPANQPLNINGVLDNISATGMYVRALKTVDTNSDVRVIVHLFRGQTSGVTADVRGRILRSELQADEYGLAIAISKSRFL